jgi:hypothetical protein
VADNPTVFRSKRYRRCPRGYYKGFAAVDPDTDDGDFHFWIEHSDGYWSHKPGSLAVTRLDASQQPIDDPGDADRGRYTEACGYYCVPLNRTLDTRSAARPATNDNDNNNSNAAN